MITPQELIKEMATRDACRTCPTLDLKAQNGWTFAVMFFLAALRTTHRLDISWWVVTAPIWTMAVRVGGFMLFGQFVHAEDRHKARVEKEMQDEDDE